MSQYFNLQLAIDTLASDAQHLKVTPKQLQNISVKVSATLVEHPQPQLQLTFHIYLPDAFLAAQLNWLAWQQSQVAFTDYLWEDTCLECFVSGSVAENTNTPPATAYIEINASPSGRYALYEFTDYRQPAGLPPRPLKQTNKKKLAYLNWYSSKAYNNRCYINKAGDDLSSPPLSLCLRLCSKLSPYPPLAPPSIAKLALLTFIPPVPYHHYECSFGIPLEQLPPALFAQNSELFSSGNIGTIHPCAILWFGSTALYFAPSHASPPDFHQRQHWTPFDYQQASG